MQNKYNSFIDLIVDLDSLKRLMAVKAFPLVYMPWILNDLLAHQVV